MKKLMWSDSSGLLNLEFTKAQAYYIPASGPADEAVKVLTRNKNVMFQFAFISDRLMVEVLKEYGAWDAEQLNTRHDNIERLIWLACIDIREGNN
jgi:hypothetical protein